MALRRRAERFAAALYVNLIAVLFGSKSTAKAPTPRVAKLKPQPRADDDEDKIVQVTIENDFFHGMGFDAMFDLHDALEPVRATSGDVLLEQGLRASAFYIIQSGEYIESIDGETVRTLSTAGDVIGDVPLMFNGVSACSVTCAVKGRLYLLDGPMFLKLVVPEIASDHAQAAFAPHPSEPQLSDYAAADPLVLLGNGAFGSVVLGVHTASGKRCALKYMSKIAFSSERNVAVRVVLERRIHQLVSPALRDASSPTLPGSASASGSALPGGSTLAAGGGASPTPPIVALLGGAQDASDLVLMLEYVEGAMLSTLIEEARARWDATSLASRAWSRLRGGQVHEDEVTGAGGLPLCLVRYYAGCLLLAMEHLEGHRVAHRDLKPDNLIVW